MIGDFKQSSPLPNQEEILHGQTEQCLSSSVDLDGELLCFRGKFEGVHLDKRLETSRAKKDEKDGLEGGCFLYTIWLCFYEPMNVEEPIIVLTSQPFELLEKCRPLVRYKPKLGRGQKRKARGDDGDRRRLSTRKRKNLSNYKLARQVCHTKTDVHATVGENPTAITKENLLIGKDDENFKEKMLKQYRELLEETMKLKAGLKSKREQVLAEKLLCEAQVLSVFDIVGQKSTTEDVDDDVVVVTTGTSFINKPVVGLNVDSDKGEEDELFPCVTTISSVPLPDVFYCRPCSISSSNSTSATTLESSNSFDDENELFHFDKNESLCKQDENILVNDAKKEGLGLEEFSLEDDDDRLSWMNFINENVNVGKTVDSSSFLS